MAVRLARTHNREEAMIEWIFANQPSLTPELVKQGARDVGQVTDFDAKYASTLESVKSDIALGKQLGVSATPTFFVNGKKIDGALPPQYFQQAIEYELAAREVARHEQATKHEPRRPRSSRRLYLCERCALRGS